MIAAPTEAMIEAGVAALGHGEPIPPDEMVRQVWQAMTAVAPRRGRKRTAASETIGAMWVEGRPIAEIATACGVTKQHVSLHAIRILGLPPRRPRATPQVDAEVQALHAAGRNLAEIGLAIGMHPATVLRRLRRLSGRPSAALGSAAG